MSDTKTITKAQYHTLLGLEVLATRHNDALKNIEKAAAEITGEKDDKNCPEYYGHTSDFIYGSRGLDEMLNLLEIKVEE